MKHDWRRGMCLYCGWYCHNCNDCTCPGAGWTKYRQSACPNFDTKGGRLRPEKPVEATWTKVFRSTSGIA